ncbi:MAG: glutamyl-tRNA reductase [Oceanococcus sp.]
MPLFALGLNYHSAPLDLRERVAIAADALPQALAEIQAVPGIREAAILSTCNRTEIFTVGGALNGLSEWLGRRGHIAPQELHPHLFSYDDQRVVRHALRVASGLDSMILGEPQILGQMKQAFRVAQEHRSLGPVLTRLFEHSFHIAKDVRTRTEIGSRSVSVAAAAASLTKEIFADLRSRDVLVIGAGDTARLVTEHLYKMGQPRITVANRSPQRAQQLAEQFKGASCGLDGIPTLLERADMVVSTITTDKRVIDPVMVKNAFSRRKRKAVLMIDLGVPRNISPEVSKNPDVYLYSVDDLQAVTEQNRKAREAAADSARDIIEAGTKDFVDWLAQRSNANVIEKLRNRTENLAATQLAQARQKLQAGHDADEVLQRLCHNMTRQFLHQPSVNLRGLSEDQLKHRLALLNELFALDEDE